MKKDISFIIPIYNNKVTDLNRCMSSIKQVKSLNSEILVVDDGSKEELGKSYKKLAAKFKAKYTRKENGGVSSARNLGINIASGKYIYFVDCDDVVDAKNFRKSDLQNKNEVIIYDVEIKDKNTKRFYLKDVDQGPVNALSILPQSLENGLLNWAVGKLYSTNFLNKNNLRFDENRMSGEDLDFVTKVLFLNPHIYYIDRVTYIYYYDRNTNINRIKNNPIKILNDVVEVYNSRKKINSFCKLDMLNNLKTDLINSIFEVYGVSLIKGKKNIYSSVKKILSPFFEEDKSKDLSSLTRKKLLWIKNNNRIKIRYFIYLKNIMSSMQRNIKYK